MKFYISTVLIANIGLAVILNTVSVSSALLIQDTSDAEEELFVDDSIRQETEQDSISLEQRQNRRNEEESNQFIYWSIGICFTFLATLVTVLITQFNRMKITFRTDFKEFRQEINGQIAEIKKQTTEDHDNIIRVTSKYENAIQDLSEIKETFQNKHKLQSIHHVSHDVELGNYKHVVATFEDFILKEIPQLIPAIAEYGFSLSKMGNRDKADIFLQTALELDDLSKVKPFSLMISVWYADNLFKNGRYDECIVVLTQILKKHPNNEPANTLIKKCLEKIKDLP